MTEYEDSEKRLIEFINFHIEKMKSYSQLGSGKEISFYELNQSLMSYQNVLISLQSLYNIARVEYQKVEGLYEEWFASKFVEVRARENTRELAASKWLGHKELEYLVQVENKEEYRERHVKLLECENRLHFLKNLVDAWNAQQFILTTLSKNVQAEASSMGVN